MLLRFISFDSRKERFNLVVINVVVVQAELQHSSTEMHTHTVDDCRVCAHISSGTQGDYIN